MICKICKQDIHPETECYISIPIIYPEPTGVLEFMHVRCMNTERGFDILEPNHVIYLNTKTVSYEEWSRDHPIRMRGEQP